ncbi:MAG: NifB/NifX family molybdenum-iron cluster-binding protein [Victivallaceae bacterium]
MKIAISTNGNDLNAAMDSRFGRAPRFIIFDNEKNTFEVIDNKQNLNAAQGAGIQSAMTVINSGAGAVITGHCGPKAFRVLNEAGLAIYNTEAKTVSEALQLYADDKLIIAKDADVEGHWV